MLRFLPVYRLTVAAMTLCLAGYTAPTFADWPQFQGPERNGMSPETGIARSWPESGPKTVWEMPLGEGFGSPAIVGNEVFILDRVRGERDILRCLSLDTGEELWQFSYDAPEDVSYPGSRTTPAVTDKHVYTVGVMGNFMCIDRATHQPVWQVDLVKQFDLGAVPNWGFSQAPSVYKDTVIVAPQTRTTSVAAFNRFTGEVLWTTPPVAGAGYVSPVIATIHGEDQVLMTSAPGNREPGTITALSVADGSKLWSYTGWSCRIPIPYPTVLPGNQVFVTGGYGAGSAMFQVTKTGGGYEVNEVFTTMDFGSQIHQPLLFDGHLYGNSNSNDRKDGMTCIALDGTMKWRTDDTKGLPGFDFGNLLGVDGLILNFEGRKGTLHLIEPSSEGYQELARADIFDGTQMWAPMAFSEGKLVLRNQSQMKCLDLVNP